MPRPASLTALASAALLAAALTACFPTDESKENGDPTAQADTVMTGVTWSSIATAFRGDTNLRVAYDCPANGTPSTVWGTDTYTDDSSVCTAGVHAGKITLAKGGRVVIKMVAGESSYSGTLRNGITTYSYAEWYFSYVFL